MRGCRTETPQRSTELALRGRHRRETVLLKEHVKRGEQGRRGRDSGMVARERNRQQRKSQDDQKSALARGDVTSKRHEANENKQLGQPTSAWLF